MTTDFIHFRQRRNFLAKAGEREGAKERRPSEEIENKREERESKRKRESGRERGCYFVEKLP